MRERIVLDENALEEDGIDVTVFRKEVKLSVKMDGVNIK